MTIHSEHPFLSPEGDRSPLRRLRGRTPAPVSVWTTGDRDRRTGWTVSSFLLADGEPAELLGLLDEDSDLAAQLMGTGTVAVSLLGWAHRGLADVFAELAPAPGGPFTRGTWVDTAWGPVLTDAAGWVGARLRPETPTHAGWGLLVRATVEHVEVGELPADGVLESFRGRYRAVPGT
ncbi:MAG: flavin reductase [Friedmanniella sp.]|nr:flavin reductase [Friedmanniella sp.]